MSRARHTERPDRHRSVRSFLDDTDEALRLGARPGATVWPTGFDLLDTTFGGGLRSGELVLLAGTEGAGKTTFAMQVMRNAVATGRHAVVFSFELTAASLIQRLLGLEAATAAEEYEDPMNPPAGVRDFRAVLEAEDPDRRGLGAAMRALTGGQDALMAIERYSDRLHIVEANRLTTMTQVANTVAAIADETGEPPIVLVDYLQKIPVDGIEGTADETTRVTYVVETLKELAMELECPVVAITAADREGLGAGHRMRTRDLRGSSALAYEADIVLILQSKENIVAREHLTYDLNAAKIYRRWVVISVEKNRFGGGQVELEVEKDFEHGRYRPHVRVVSERLIEERVFTT